MKKFEMEENDEKKKKKKNTLDKEALCERLKMGIVPKRAGLWMLT